jgi:hypothetical protein
VGGGDHRTGKKGGGFENSRIFRHCIIPAAPKNTLGDTGLHYLDGLPYIGRYSNALPDVYARNGFNELGMTGSMLSARVLTERITGKDCEYGELFNPARSALHARSL